MGPMMPEPPPSAPPTKHEPLCGSTLDHAAVPFVLRLSTADDRTHVFPITTLERLSELRQDLEADPFREALVAVKRDPRAVGDSYDRWIRIIRDGASAHAHSHLELPGFFGVLVRALEGQRDQNIIGVEWVQTAAWLRSATTWEGAPPPLQFTPPAGLRSWVMCVGVVPDAPPPPKGWPAAPSPTSAPPTLASLTRPTP